MEWTLSVGASVVGGGILLVLAAVLAVTFGGLGAARWWVASGLAAGLGGLLAAIPVPGTSSLRNIVFLGAALLAALGALRWVREAGGTRSLAAPLLLAVGTVTSGAWLAAGQPWAAAWVVVPVAVSAWALGRRATAADQAPVRSQAQGLLGAWLVGWGLFSAGTLVTLMVPGASWAPALPLSLALGTVLTHRSLHRFDPRFPPHPSHGFVVERTQDSVLFLKSDGTIHAGNPALKPLLDYEEPELVGRPLSSLGVDDESQRLLGALERLTFPDWEGTIGLTHRAGRPVPVHLVFRRVHNPAREAVGAVILLYDLRLPRRLDLSTREDRLTSLSNRRWVLELLEAEFQRVKRYGGSLSALWLQIVDLADLEARAGADAADEVLRRLGAILRGGLRKTDFCGRVGPQEFLAVLPETDPGRAGLVGRRLEGMFALSGEGEASNATLRVVAGSLGDDDRSSEAFVHRLEQL